METDILNNNKVYVQGTVGSEPEFNHTVHDENFYSFTLVVPRLSGKTDSLPVLISEKLLVIKPIQVGDAVAIRGQFRSHNQMVDGKSKLILSVFCRELTDCQEEVNPNTIELDGYLCKPPIYRTTPFSKEICDILIAVNRNYDKSDYIPCIAWGRNANFVRSLPVGAELKLTGRVQSRDYGKRVEGSDDIVTKTAYEVSISSLSLENAVSLTDIN